MQVEGFRDRVEVSLAAGTFGDGELRARLKEAPVYCFEAVMLALLEKAPRC